jgi:crossover junction endodeoxyribonuclease RuvC
VRVLGVDPGLGITGYAVVEISGGEAQLLEAGAIRAPAERSLPERLRVISADLREVIAELAPEVVGLESLYSEYRFPRSALQMAHARGVICLAAAEAGLEVVDLAPGEVKNALIGEGRATKGQIQRSVQALYGLEELPRPPDVADAIAIATAVAFRLARR